ncbi:MAG: hypothetical protein JWN67_1012 [Actinomycetia bacterium]|nr:hypothetical protein [Actinomycetes bacterium]
MSDDLRRTLEGAGTQDAPPPDPAFVRDLEARLAGGVVAAAPRARRPFLPAAAAVVVVAAGIGLAIGLSHDDSPSDQVRTEPNPSVTTSTLLGAPTTTVLLPPVTATTVPSTTSTTARPSSTPTTTVPQATTIPPTTTSTTGPPTFQDLHLACTTDAPTLTISCRWDASTSPAFASFRLTRRTHDGPENVVYTGTGREFSEPSGTGARWVYLVTALDASGRSLGSSTVDTTCC